MQNSSSVQPRGAMLGEPWVSSNLIGNLSEDYNPGPQEDYYVYVNRDFLLNGEIEEGETQSMPMIDLAMHDVHDKCAELLAGDTSDESDVRSAQNYYKLMRNWEWRNKTGVAPLDEELKRIDAVSSIDELTELLCDPDPLHRPEFLSASVGMDLLAGNVYGAYVQMNVNILFENDAAEYANPSPTGLIQRQMAHDTFMLIASKTSIADRAEAIWEASLAYQTEMTKYYPTAADLAVSGAREKLAANRVTREELAANLGSFPTQRVLEAQGYGDVDEFIEPIKQNDALVASCYDEEHLEGIKALLMLMLIKGSDQLLTEEIYKAAKHIRADAIGSTYKNDEVDQRRKAFQKVFKDLPTPTSKLYVSRYGDEHMRDEIRGMCDNIVRVYKKMLAAEEWLSESTRAYAIEKLDAMKFRVLFPDTWEDYSTLDIRSAEEGETLWSAWCKAAAFNKTLMRPKLGKEVDIELMPECIETNCNYNPYNNSVNIYLGFLGEMTYQSSMSIEEKMGALGMVIGHEISHGFDINGMLHDKYGAAKVWCTDEDRAAFEARAQKAMDWYETVYKPRTQTMPGIGQRSVGETIADLGSLSVALTLAREIEDFDYDKFFRAFGRVWSRLDNEFWFDFMLQIDEHPMGNLRVNLTLAQCDEFHKTYGVKEGDKMYFAPEDRIRVW
ncbi:MAG: M13 family metallopeptidase [Coriobacteriales bacterium]|nr:M13 family metallopeptidase [Coriobacteriales bacterium]